MEKSTVEEVEPVVRIEPVEKAETVENVEPVVKVETVEDVEPVVKELWLGSRVLDKLRNYGYGDAFSEMSVMENGVVLRGEGFVIPKKLNKKTVDVEVRVDNTVLVKKTKLNIKPPFDSNPYTVMGVDGTQAILKRIGKTLKRNFNKLKIMGRKMQDKEKKRLLKEKESKEKTAGGGTKKEDP